MTAKGLVERMQEWISTYESDPRDAWRAEACGLLEEAAEALIGGRAVETNEQRNAGTPAGERRLALGAARHKGVGASASPDEPAASLLDRVREILKGIDSDEVRGNYGWWETSTGAEWGRAKLAEIEAAFREAEIL